MTLSVAMHKYSFVTCCLLVVPLACATPLQLDPLLNLTSIFLHNTSMINTAAFIPNECFEPDPQHLPTNFLDCQAAANQINPRHKTQIFTFSRQSSTDPNHITLPQSYRSGTCIIYLDMVYGTDSESSLTLPEVYDASLHLARECAGRQVEIAARLGGIMSIGSSNLLRIVIFGRQYPFASAQS